MKVKLTAAERILIANIVGFQLERASLKEHLMLDSVYEKIDVENIPIPTPLDFLENKDDAILFEKYNNKPISEIEDEHEREIVKNALDASKDAEQRIYENNQKEETLEVGLDDDEVDVLNTFFDKDKRPFSRQFHQAIVDLHKKLKSKK